MYLCCLAPPPALLAEPAHRPHDLAWSIELPSTAQCEGLREWLSARLTDWRRRRDSTQYSRSRVPDSADTPEDAQVTANNMDQEESSYFHHLEQAFARWKALTDEERREQWHHECAKAFAREKEKHQVTRQRLDETDQELRQLRSRCERLSLDGHGPDIAQFPITVFPLSREAVSHLPRSQDLDSSALIGKWRNRLQTARSKQHPLPQARSTPAPQPQDSPAREQRVVSPVQHRDSWTGETQGSNDSEMADEDDAELIDAPGEEDPDHVEEEHQQSHVGVANAFQRSNTAIPSSDSRRSALGHTMDVT